MLGKIKLSIFIFVLFLSFQPLHAESNERVSEEKVKSSPNPLELEKEWWKYFDVSEEVLPEKIENFKKELDNIIPVIEGDELEEIVKTKNDVFFNLNLLTQTLSQKKTGEPLRLQFLKEYSISQILEINSHLLSSRSEITNTREKIEFEKNRLSLTQSELDKKMLSYANLTRSSYERLLTGLKIIEYRIKSIVTKIKINHLRALLDYRVKEKDLLVEELKDAQKKVKYDSLVREDLTLKLEQSNNDIEFAKIKLEKLEKEQLYNDSQEIQSDLLCCLSNYQVITQTINIENLIIGALINEIKLSLLNSSDPAFESNKQTNAQLMDWDKMISRAAQLLEQWQQQLESDHAQVSKMIAEMSKPDQENKRINGDTIADIHLQIDHSFALMEDLIVNISQAELLLKFAKSRFIEEKSLSQTWWIRIKTSWADFIEGAKERASVTLFYVNETPVTLGTLFKAILTIILIFFLSKYLQSFLSRRMFRSHRTSKSTQYIILRLLHYSLIIIAVLIALSLIGLDMTNIAIVAGALGVGIGFGLQTMVNNILSGFTLLLNRYLKVGDIVEMEGEKLATVKAINLQSTHICTFDGADQIIPNSLLATRGLTNWTMKNSYRRFKVPFKVSYGSDKVKLKTVILEAVEKESYIVTGNSQFSNPQLWFVEFGDSSLHFDLVVWVDLSIAPPYGTARSSLLWKIDDILATNGFIVPYPQHNLHIK